MSHREDCPDRWVARREGERAFDRGQGPWRNPYKSSFPDEGCPEAAREWDRAYRDAEYQEEERRRQEDEALRMREQQREQERLWEEQVRYEYEREQEQQESEEIPPEDPGAAH